MWLDNLPLINHTQYYINRSTTALTSNRTYTRYNSVQTTVHIYLGIK